MRGGARVNTPDRRGLAPLHWAGMRSTAPAIVKALLAAGANPDVRDNRVRTPLHYAAAKDEVIIEVVEALLDAGADPAAKDSEGKTPQRASSPTPTCAVRRRISGWGGEFRLMREEFLRLVNEALAVTTHVAGVMVSLGRFANRPYRDLKIETNRRGGPVCPPAFFSSRNGFIRIQNRCDSHPPGFRHAPE